VVRVTKRQLHPGNLAMIRGISAPLPAEGLVPGGDGVGIVEAVGATGLAAQVPEPGVRVIFNPSPGAWAGRLTRRAELVTPIPDDLPDAIAAPLLPNTVIAVLLLRAAERAVPDCRAGNTDPHDRRRVGCGAHRNHGGPPRGLNIMGAVRSAEGAKALSARFADMSVVSTADWDWTDEVRRAAGEQLLHVVMDPAGGSMVGHLAGLLGGNGALALYGGLAGSPPAERTNLAAPRTRRLLQELTKR